MQNSNIKSNQSLKIGVIGLGYVGLPLSIALAAKYQVVGFDINNVRVRDINNFRDLTGEITEIELRNNLKSSLIEIFHTENGLYVTDKFQELSNCNFYIVTVPTPVDKNNRPVLNPLIEASKSIGTVLKHGDYVVYESTVYPGVTEDICVPELSKQSNLKFNEDFFVGYSPERINPGDKSHTVTKIRKVTSGSTPEAANFIDSVYSKVITAGTFKASSIKVAEAAKVIENTQRDINIAFINELSKIFNLLEIDTREVLEAASTKWNFINFSPGLVGGHCIGVDPYYLAQKSQEMGYHPEIILAGRRINDSMGKHVAIEVVKLMIKKGLKVNDSKALILGITFKENCPDIRNTKVIDIYNELLNFGINIDVYDPNANLDDVNKEHGITLITELNNEALSEYSSIIIAVAHDEFLNLKLKSNKTTVVYDLKGILPQKDIDARL